MISSDIWHKYHLLYFHSDTYFEISRVVFMPNVTYKSCYSYYLFILLPVKGLYLHMYRVFSHDVTAAILVSQNNETAAMLVSQTNPVWS